jgi:hypothetical protein
MVFNNLPRPSNANIRIVWYYESAAVNAFKVNKPSDGSNQ